MFFGVRLPEQEPLNWSMTGDFLDRISAAEERKKSDSIKRLKAWALKEGSDLLKARIEEGFEWQELAETEWYDEFVYKPKMTPPQGYVSVTPNVAMFEERAPSLKQINGLKSARYLFSQLNGFSKIDIVSYSVDSKKCWAYRVHFESPSGKAHYILVAPF